MELIKKGDNMRVYTNIKTLKQVKRILAELELSGMIEGEKVQSVDLSEILDKLLDQGKLVEFLQIVTKDTETDFEEMEAKEIGEIIQGFFTGITGFLPESLKGVMAGSLKAQLSQKISS